MTVGLKIVLAAAQILTVLSAVAVTFHPNILYASIALFFAFCGVAVMFVYAGADFLAGAQLIVYAGGVTILVLFAIMLTQWLYKSKLRDIRMRVVAPLALIAPALTYGLCVALRGLGDHVLKTTPANFEAFSSAPKTMPIGQALLTNYLLPFEAITILLLSALVGGVWLARPK
ncbi:MAG: NADH-quinone oxidoreductase subunit J [Deltaproteobacteria bacterium]|nr:NADH-quinone oxidoreductase subunit J [Deltaproteobacteria bacterium]MBI3295461.1 NADH-quinone oxidoreductase subunit J [Deltaproteobacteria bacterium]